jgi:hypothetical protein
MMGLYILDGQGNPKPCEDALDHGKRSGYSVMSELG